MGQKKIKILRKPPNRIKIDPNLRVDDNCPFLVRKMEDAIEFLKRAPIPEWVFDRHLLTEASIKPTTAPGTKRKTRRKKHL
jgi:hypothetical protein